MTAGISWDLDLPYLPRDRRAYPRAPFASLWTQRESDADAAYARYRDRLRTHGWRPGALFDVFGGRPFRVPAIEATTQYRNQYGRCHWSGDERGQLARALGAFDGEDIAVLRYVVGRVRPVLFSTATHGITRGGTVVGRLAGVGWLVTEPAPPKRARDERDYLIRYQGPTRELVAWEIGRRDWLCEMLVRYQFAYEATQSSMRQYRESGVVTYVELLGQRDWCAACAKAYPKRVPVSEHVEMPVGGCTRDDGCICSVVPVVDRQW